MDMIDYLNVLYMHKRKGKKKLNDKEMGVKNIII